MVTGKKSRANMRNHRKFIHAALEEYITQASNLVGMTNDTAPIRIIKSVRSTRVRIPRNIMPDEFIQMVLSENENKKYRIEFCQSRVNHIEIILHNKSLLEEGQGILLFFFRELLQHLNKNS